MSVGMLIARGTGTMVAKKPEIKDFPRAETSMLRSPQLD
jgi:hypothetical protein